METVVYHGSAQHGLTRLSPRESTHGRAWVYATPLLPIAAIQLQKGGDLNCAHGLHDEQVFLYERWPGAFETRYAGKSGSIYELPGDTFEAHRTSFSAEVVSETAVGILREHHIADAQTYLWELSDEGVLRIYMHDERPPWIPEDDQDLVDRIVRWSNGDLDSHLEKYAAQHLPHLMNRIHRALRSPA